MNCNLQIRSRGRPKNISDEERRWAVLSAAWEVFRREGYSGTTMDSVAQQAEMSKRTIYQVFPSKDALFGAIITTHGQKLLALPRAHDDVPIEQALAEIFRADMDPDKVTKIIDVMRLICSEADKHDEFRDLFIDYGPAKSHALLTEWLEVEKTRGRLDLDDANHAASILFDMMFGQYDTFPGQERFIKRTSHKDHIERVARIFVNGTKAQARTESVDVSPPEPRAEAGQRCSNFDRAVARQDS